MAQNIRMCLTCAGAFKYDDSRNDIPDTHADVGEECPTFYRD